MSAFETLRVARNLIVTHGHVKGSFGDDEHGYCAYGAIIEAAKESTDATFLGAVKAFVEQIPEHQTIRNAAAVTRVSTWNDHPDRTPAEVIAAFDRALQTENAAAKQ